MYSVFTVDSFPTSKDCLLQGGGETPYFIWNPNVSHEEKSYMSDRAVLDYLHISQMKVPSK